MKKKMLGEILIEAGLINEFQLAGALGQQKQWGGKLGSELVRLGYLSEEDLASALQKQLGIKWLSLQDISIPPEVVRVVSAENAKKYYIMPVAAEEKTVTVAMTDPTDLRTVDTLGFVLGKRIKTVIATKTDIKWAISRYYNQTLEDDADRKAPPQRAAGASVPPPGPAVAGKVFAPGQGKREIKIDAQLEALVDLLSEKGLIRKEDFLKKLK